MLLSVWALAERRLLARPLFCQAHLPPRVSIRVRPAALPPCCPPPLPCSLPALEKIGQQAEELREGKLAELRQGNLAELQQGFGELIVRLPFEVGWNNLWLLMRAFLFIRSMRSACRSAQGVNSVPGSKQPPNQWLHCQRPAEVPGVLSRAQSAGICIALWGSCPRAQARDPQSVSCSNGLCC